MTDHKATITTILKKIDRVNKSRRDFFTHTLILFLSIRSRINFLQLGRYSNRYCESTFRLQFEQFFDFMDFNIKLAQEHGSGHFIIAFDPSYIGKSGRNMPNTGKFWSGCSSRMEWGLEASVLLDNHTGFHLDAVLSPDKEECPEKGISLLYHYTSMILLSAPKIEQISSYLAVDAYFAKKGFIVPILKKTNLHIICRFRDDADLQYLYKGPRSLGK